MILENCKFCDSDKTGDAPVEGGWCCVCFECGARGPVKPLLILAYDAWGVVRSNEQINGQLYKVVPML